MDAANSRHFFMSDNTENLAKNGAILIISHMIKTVVYSATEAELGALDINFCKDVPAQHTLEEMGQKQPPTPVQTDNITALGVVKKRNEKLKSMDMEIHLLYCRVIQS